MDLVKPKIKPKPLPLVRKDKLKIFAIACLHKDIPPETLKDKMTLAIAVTYTPAEAILGAREGITILKKDPDEYLVPFMLVQKDADELIDLTQQQMHIVPMSEMPPGLLDAIKNSGMPPELRELFKGDTPPVQEQPKKLVVNKDIKKDASVEHMLSYVRYVFDKSGTPAQQKVAEAVIKKFQQYVKQN